MVRCGYRALCHDDIAHLDINKDGFRIIFDLIAAVHPCFCTGNFDFIGRRRRGGIAVAEYCLIRGLSVFGKRPRHFQYAVFFSNLHCIGVNRGIVGPAVFARILFDDAVGVNAGLCIADFAEARFASACNGYGLSPVYRALRHRGVIHCRHDKPERYFRRFFSFDGFHDLHTVGRDRRDINVPDIHTVINRAEMLDRSFFYGVLDFGQAVRLILGRVERINPFAVSVGLYHSGIYHSVPVFEVNRNRFGQLLLTSL